MLDSTAALGDYLREARRRSGLSQRAYAARAGVGAASVARVESASRTGPSLALVLVLLAAAGWRLVVTDADGHPVALSATGWERARDRGGRRFPPYLALRPVRRLADWRQIIDGRMLFQPLPEWTYRRRAGWAVGGGGPATGGAAGGAGPPGVPAGPDGHPR